MSAELVPLTADLLAFVETTEALGAKRTPTPEGSATWRAGAAELAGRFTEARERVDAALQGAVDDTASNLRALAHELESATVAERRALRLRWRSLSTNYEKLAAHIRSEGFEVPPSLHLGRVKPRNYLRNLFHVSNGLVAIVAYWFLFSRWEMVAIGCGVLVLFVAFDMSRRFSERLNHFFIDSLFGWLARPSDAHGMPSSTWYTVGLTLGTALYPKNAIVLGALVLAFGDPVATLAGKRFGKRRLFRDKTIAGSAGFFAAALIIGVTFLGAVSPELGPVHIALTATLAATAGTVIELFGEVVEDNLTIPLLVGGVVALLL